MKNVLLTLAICLLSLALTAQPISKKGEPYLPSAGDWGLSIDAMPLLDYIGNFFTTENNNSPSIEFANNNFAITGRKFVTADKAYRAGVRLNIFSDTEKAFSPEFILNEVTNTTVEDKYTRNFTNTYLSLGIEWRKGKTRVQGYYGAEAALGFGTQKQKFEYGNDITNEDTDPERSIFEVQFENNSDVITNQLPNGAWITELKAGSTFSIGARGFLGAEVFIFPKMSLGFEFGFSAAFFYTGNGSVTSEQWTIPVGGNSEQYVTTITDIGGDSEFRMDNDNSGGAIFLNFYF
jgi:hypothetical protein